MTQTTYLETRRKRDWFMYILLLAAVVCLPEVIVQIGWVPQASRLLWAATAGALIGVLLARSPLPTWLAWLVGLALALDYALQYATGLLPGLGVLLGDLGKAAGWVWDLAAGRAPGPGLPFARTAGHVSAQWQVTTAGVTDWVVAAQAGTLSRDNTVLQFGISLIIFVLSWNAGFELFRKRRTFVALLPLGTAVIANVGFTDLGGAYVHFFLGVMLLTLVQANLERIESFWAGLGLDFSQEIRRDATIAGTALAALVLVAGLLMPYVTYARAVYGFWDRYGSSFLSFYDRLDDAFAGRNPVPEPTPGGMTRSLAAHTIGEGALPTEDVVFYVTISDSPPPPESELEYIGDLSPEDLVPKRYWRERTYDTYTGYGWDNSAREEETYQGMERWRDVDYAFEVLTQTYELKMPSPVLSYGVNEPVTVDKAYSTYTRDSDDLVGFRVEAREYAVVSWVPQPSVQDLQQAEGSYPDWVANRFLALPDSVPDRVQEFARDVVAEAGATTRYDEARAIERSIRQLEYDLTLEPPSLDTDFVDYYLFTAQRGYCDYAASAMVVMLRSVGVAARYASGYNMGYYDYYAAAWVVKEQNSHAWAEVYFPEYGWIEFEPSASQNTFSRPSTLGGGDSLLASATPERVEQGIPMLWKVAAGLALLVLFVVIWPTRWLGKGQRDPRSQVERVYHRLVRRARWAGMAPYEGQTPREYTTALGDEMARRAEFTAAASTDLAIICRAYYRALYSERELRESDQYEVEAAWRRVRGPIARLVFVSSPPSSRVRPIG